jgi:hypothetical protein
VFIPRLNCTEFTLEYPYMTNDYVCNENKNLFACMEPVHCPFSAPTYYSNNIWAEIDPVFPNYVNVTDPGNVTCVTYDAILNGNTTGNFSIGDIACESSRAWTCSLVKNCNKFSP